MRCLERARDAGKALEETDLARGRKRAAKAKGLHPAGEECRYTGGMKKEKLSPTERPMLFEIDPEAVAEALTALGGLPLLVQAFRSLEVGRSVKEHVGIRQRDRGYDEPTMVESFVLLNGAGGECLEDFEQLRKEAGLAELIGHEFPSPEAARQCLYAFHEEEKIAQAKLRRKPEEIAYIPEESAELAGLGLVNRELVQRFGLRCPDQRIATVDQDATIIESRKQEALRTCEGERGYQPMLAVWAEMNVVLADEFRDGPALRDAGDHAAIDGGEGGPAQRDGAARDGEDVLLPRRFGLSRKRVGKLAAGRTTSGRSARIHWVWDQRTDERGTAAGDSGGTGRGMETVRGSSPERDSGMRRGAVCADGEVGT